MTRTVFCLILALASVLASQLVAQEPKQIKDPIEYRDYMAALNTKDPAAKAAAMDAFVVKYPNSVVKLDALEEATAAYQQAGNSVKVGEKAKQIVDLDPGNIRALAILAFLGRSSTSTDSSPACGYAKSGLEKLPSWQKPEGTTDADFEKMRKQMAAIFNGEAGFCALQKKDFATARTFYEKALQSDPSSMQDVYQLAVAELEATPIGAQGFWYCSRAIQLAQQQGNSGAANGIEPYCKAKYKKYHGSEDGWAQVMALTASGTTPPSSFSVKPAPTPCEIAVQAVQQNDVRDLPMGDKEFILSKANCSPANKLVADKVWQSIQDLQKGGAARLLIPVKVISATSQTIEAAISDDNQIANKPDLHVQLERPLVKPPVPGTTVQVVGVITNYTPDPFMFTMEKGDLPAPKPGGRTP